MSLDRLHSLIDTTPKPFPISGREAHLLIDALDAYTESYKRAVPQETVEDSQADSETLAHCHDLQQRLYEFCGYERRPR